MQEAAENRKIKLEFRQIASILVEVRWPHPVKYDVVNKFVKKAIEYDFDIKPAESEESVVAEAGALGAAVAAEQEEAADVAVSATVLADVEAHAPSVSLTSGAESAGGAVSASDQAVRALPPHLLPLKMEQVLVASAELCPQEQLRRLLGSRARPRQLRKGVSWDADHGHVCSSGGHQDDSRHKPGPVCRCVRSFRVRRFASPSPCLAALGRGCLEGTPLPPHRPARRRFGGRASRQGHYIMLNSIMSCDVYAWVSLTCMAKGFATMI